MDRISRILIFARYLSLSLWVGLCLIIPTQAKGSAATLPQGKAFTEVSFLYLATQEFFLGRNTLSGIPPGSLVAYSDSGELRFSTLQTTLWYGLSDEINLGVVLPLHDAQFKQTSQTQEDLGIGDLTFGVKYRFLEVPFLLTGLVLLKSPTGNLAISEAILPLTEGQWDALFAEEIGLSLEILPVDFNVMAGYKRRFTNEETGVKPGDEIVYAANMDVQCFRWFRLRADLEGFQGMVYEKRDENERVTFGFRRSSGVFSPGLIFTGISRFAFLLQANISLYGEDYPAGIQWQTSLSYRFDIF